MKTYGIPGNQRDGFLRLAMARVQQDILERHVAGQSVEEIVESFGIPLNAPLRGLVMAVTNRYDADQPEGRAAEREAADAKAAEVKRIAEAEARKVWGGYDSEAELLAAEREEARKAQAEAYGMAT